MKLGRRAFMAAGAVVAALGGAAVYLAKPFQERQLSAAEKQACGLTVEAVEGPYHVSGMGELKDGDLNDRAQFVSRERHVVVLQSAIPRHFGPF